MSCVKQGSPTNRIGRALVLQVEEVEAVVAGSIPQWLTGTLVYNGKITDLRSPAVSASWWQGTTSSNASQVFRSLIVM